MTAWMGAALVAALAGSPHCLGMCGALACVAGGRVEQQAGYHVGRVGTYAALGALAGSMGGALPGPPWLGSAIAAVFLVGFAASLAGLVPEPKISVPGLARVGAQMAARVDVPSRVVFGAVNGLLPCGLVYATLSLAVAAGSALAGAAVMTVFGLATVPALAVATLGFRKVVAGSRLARQGLAAVVLVTGLGTLGFRAGWFVPAAAAQAESDLPPCHQP